MASTADEMSRLLRIARRKSDAGRRQLVAICSDLLNGDSTVLTNVEHALMRDILARLIEALSAPLRRALSDHLAVLAPQHSEAVANLVAEPVDLVAPVLLGIESAIELELVETIRNRALEHRLMLAMRRSQADVADSPTGEDAIDTLLNFPDPAVPPLAMNYLVEQARRFDQFLEPVVLPEELSPQLRHKLKRWLLAGLRHHLQQQLRIEPTRLDDAVDEVVDAIGAAAPGTPAPDAATVLARSLGACGAINSSLMLQVLRQGEVSLFIALLAEIGGLRPALVRRLLFEPGGDGLAMLCRAIGLGRSVLASIFLLTRRARPTQRATGPGELSQVLALYDGIVPAAARDVVARWRRDRDFLTALRFIEDAAAGAEADALTEALITSVASDGAEGHAGGKSAWQN
jgi:uncharacterized protein (DUF2336 family)